MTDYDEAYQHTAAYFGDAPDPMLGNFIHLLDPDGEILDVGCGQGRNALYLASQGYSVTALDPSPVAIGQVDRSAADQALSVRTRVGGFGEVDLPAIDFSAVMVFGLIPDLPWNLTQPLVGWARSTVAPGGTLWLTGFTTEDPAFEQHKKDWQPLDHNSFVGPDGTVRTYLDPGAILELAADLETIHHWEGLGPQHRHGHGPMERHGRFEVIFRIPG